MNTKFLSVTTTLSDIYHGLSTWKTFWEDNFTPVSMKSWGSNNVRKRRETNNRKRYIVLEVSSDIYCLDKREVNYSESRYHMGISGKGTNTSLYLSTKTPNKKKKSSITITEITNQDFSKFLQYFKNPPYLGYKHKQVYN